MKPTNQFDIAKSFENASALVARIPYGVLIDPSRQTEGYVRLNHTIDEDYPNHRLIYRIAGDDEPNDTDFEFSGFLNPESRDEHDRLVTLDSARNHAGQVEILFGPSHPNDESRRSVVSVRVTNYGVKANG